MWKRMVAVSIITLLVLGTYALSRADSQDVNCAEQWYSLTDAEREQCSTAVGNIEAVMETNTAIDFATVAAKPSTVPMAGITAMAETYVALGSPTEVPTAPIGILPEQYRRIGEMSREDISGTSESYKYNASVWHVGGRMTESGTPEMLFVATPRGNCAIRTFEANGNMFVNPQIWPCPEDVGEIVITGFVESANIVNFTGIYLDIGSFNLHTKEWTRNNMPWLPLGSTSTSNPHPGP